MESESATKAHVVNLFISPDKGKLEEVEQLQVKPGGCVGDKNFGQDTSREVLVMDQELNEKHQRKPGATKENIILKGFNIHKLKSGDRFQINGATFVVQDKLCCKNENPAMKYERGVFCSVQPGTESLLKKNDQVLLLK